MISLYLLLNDFFFKPLKLLSMKRIMLFSMLLLFHFAASAQFSGSIKVINNNPCKIYVDLLVSEPGSPCNSQQYATGLMLIAPFTSIGYPMATPPVVVGSPLPVPSASTWEGARVLDNCGAVTVGDPCSFMPTGIINSCCNAYHVTWDPSTQSLTIN